ncbi:hypothetical protein AMJ39_03455 [candidate division TA06 bacterium DG_24]|uniref:Ribonuclease G n=3 Tax=Bacteria division TA06 TaxID=1156500 RepID=A0A0S8JKA4_UNCT6|nr:MAG: hypothetical protein AMJ39_03455 [candidate division TA06 bacterium DG_24]KPK70142.1 MAG: hypothetical protein AMJ82_03895 [candidate division TA06 bacterium SM23_40]KPL09810.1 MAG: hypothetical protein AMJ71_05490 [candidate division TA06 bacterium SM1_40]
MHTSIIVNADTSETRIAILEDQRLVELYIERVEQKRMVGDIYKGRVVSILPGLRAAFVDIATERNAFLPLADVTQELLELEGMDDIEIEEKGSRRAPIAAERLKEGQEVLVQVSKETMGTKGPRVTSYVSLPGRYVVLMPGVEHIGISRRISDREERDRLRNIVANLRPKGMGLIVRTAAEGHKAADFRSDVRSLVRQWNKIKKGAEKKKAPSLIHKDIGLTLKLIRDLFTPEVNELIIDSKDEYKQVVSYVNAVSRHLRPRVHLYQGDIPIFESHGVEAQIEKALERKVWLKTGGYITVDQTEALAAIDVNTGRFSKERDPEKMILKTNTEAAREIARQLRLRDVGGIIVIDFIDMVREENKRKVLNELKTALKRDRSRTKALRVSDLGLIEMTRERARPSLLHTFSDPCPTCDGTGRVLSKLTVALKIERWLRHAGPELVKKRIQLRTHPTLADYLSIERVETLSEIARLHQIGVVVKGDPSYSIEDFRVFLLDVSKDITEEYEA